MKPVSTARRSPAGASLALVAVSVLICVLLVWAGFNYSMLMGGSRQVRNAVDAAVLNVSKRSVESKVAAADTFKDVADSGGLVGLSNINRVWGKALLVNANVAEMKQTGQVTGKAIGAGATAYNIAQKVNDDLVASLKNEKRLNMYFRHISNSRQATALGGGSAVNKSEAESYQFAMVGRGEESNLSFSQEQLPGNVEVNGTSCCGKNFLQGYSPMTVNGKPFYFTTFHVGEMPHLISENLFAANKGGVPQVANPVPNAFRAYGEVLGEKGSLKASASAVANPMRQFTLAIPHGFITIQTQNLAKWYAEDEETPKKTTTYGFESETQWGLKEQKMKNGGYLNGYASLGNEYKNPSLMGAIDALPGDKTVALKKMLQRVQEIKSDFTMDQLKALLRKQKMIKSNQLGTYFIYPSYKMPDFSDPSIKIGSSKKSLPSWLDPNLVPEGQNSPILEEPTLKNDPNTAWGDITGGTGPPNPIKWTELSGVIYWKPGTGLSQNLGTLHLARTTKVFFKSPQ